MNMLKNKVAIITGASSGIGRAAARLFAQEGAALVVTARRQDELDALVCDITRDGGRAAAVGGDIRDEALAATLVEVAVATYGGLDIALNNAGILGELVPVTEMTLENWSDVMAVNLTAAFLGARQQVPAMVERGGGSIIFTSSFVGTHAGVPGMSAYASSKAALEGLARTLAAEFGPSGVRVNTLLPGGTETAMAPSAETHAEWRDWAIGLHALKRFAKPEEIARAALFMASDQASFMTGASISIDGGAAINRA